MTRLWIQGAKRVTTLMAKSKSWAIGESLHDGKWNKLDHSEYLMLKSSLPIQHRSESSGSFFTSITSISLQDIFRFLYNLAYTVSEVYIPTTLIRQASARSF